MTGGVSPDRAVLSAERQFLGHLMWLDPDRARTALAGLRPSDLADPVAEFVLRLAIQAVAAGHNPAPTILFDAATEVAERPQEFRLQRVGKWIIDAYGAAGPAPQQHCAHLKGIVLRAAWRRAVREHAIRVLQVAEHGTTNDLKDQVDNTAKADNLWVRFRAATSLRRPRPVPARSTTTDVPHPSAHRPTIEPARRPQQRSRESS
ncbi:hypothetical protein [Amycolatopsis sp. GM8]|uniref:hypothetical protein n=1 Tax=Amycolatopsis sp. GM8 TaxID=2896530 RepID=UPI001F23F51F|nr:hypothetical protein [Amycolatopsis sp. GM8]